MKRNDFNYGDMQEKLKKKFVSLNVYYDDLSYTQIDESPKTEMVDLISNIGGTLGLFIGVNFFNFIEIVELFLQILFIIFKSEKKIRDAEND